MPSSNVDYSLASRRQKQSPAPAEKEARERSERAVDLFVRQRQLGNLELVASCIDTIVDDAPISPGLIPYSLLEDLKRLGPQIEKALALAEHADVTKGEEIA